MTTFLSKVNSGLSVKVSVSVSVRTKFEMKIFQNRSGILSCLGGFLLSLALSLDYSYPNLNTYVTSYLRQNGSDKSSLC